MSSVKHILFLVPGFPQDESDTTCLPYLQNFVRIFSTLNPNMVLSVIAFQYPYEMKNYTWNNINVYSIGGRGKKHFFRVRSWVAVLLRFLIIHSCNRVDVIHSFWLTECSFIGQIMGKLFGVKHIASIMGQDAFGNNAYLRRLDFERMTVTSCSKKAAAIFRSSSHRDVYATIPWGIDMETFDKMRNGQARTIDILGVGSLTKIKNFELFIDTVIEVLKDFPLLKTVLIGEGEEREALIAKISKSNLQKQIELTGLLPRERVIQYMLRSKILLHTSRYEGQGYVFSEALYAGMTVVAFDVGHLRPSNKVFICRDNGSMLAQLKTALSYNRNYNAFLLDSMHSTVQSFKDLYEKAPVV